MISITELVAVNMMLEAVGETRVTTLAGTLPTDVSTAQTSLGEGDGEFQMTGWSFNKRMKVSLAPDAGSPYRTYLPTNTLLVHSRKRSKKYGMRKEETGSFLEYLYDITEDTDALGETIKVDLIVGLNFIEMPYAAKNYIAKNATRVFAERVFGEPQPQLRSDEARAYSFFERYETETMDYRMSDTLSVYRSTHRISSLDDYSS